MLHQIAGDATIQECAAASSLLVFNMIWGLVLEAAFYMLCMIPELIFALFYIAYQWLANFSKAAVSLVTGKTSNDKNQNDLQKEKDDEDEFLDKVDNILNWEFTLYKKIKSLLLGDTKEVKDGELVSINGKEINVIDARNILGVAGGGSS